MNRFEIRNEIVKSLTAQGFSFAGAGGIMIAPYKTHVLMEKDGETFRIEITPIDGENAAADS